MTGTLFAMSDMPIFKNRRVHFRNSWMKQLDEPHQALVWQSIYVQYIRTKREVTRSIQSEKRFGRFRLQNHCILQNVSRDGDEMD